MLKLLPTDSIVKDILKFCCEKIQQHHNEIDLMQLRGLVYLTSGEPEKALTDFSAVIDHDPTNQKSYYLRSRAYYEMSDFDHSLQDYLRALKVELPTDQEFADRHPDSEILDSKIKDHEEIKDIDTVTKAEVKDTIFQYGVKYDNESIKKLVILHLEDKTS